MHPSQTALLWSEIGFFSLIFPLSLCPSLDHKPPLQNLSNPYNQISNIYLLWLYKKLLDQMQTNWKIEMLVDYSTNKLNMFILLPDLIKMSNALGICVFIDYTILQCDLKSIRLNGKSNVFNYNVGKYLAHCVNICANASELRVNRHTDTRRSDPTNRPTN